MHERIKLVRLNSGLNITDFGERVGMKRSGMSLIENGKRGVSKHIIKSVCREFKVNENWLLTGEGEMYSSSVDDETIADISADLFKETDRRRIVLMKFVQSLDEEDLKALEKIWSKLPSLKKEP